MNDQPRKVTAGMVPPLVSHWGMWTYTHHDDDDNEVTAYAITPQSGMILFDVPRADNELTYEAARALADALMAAADIVEQDEIEHTRKHKETGTEMGTNFYWKPNDEGQLPAKVGENVKTDVCTDCNRPWTEHVTFERLELAKTRIELAVALGKANANLVTDAMLSELAIAGRIIANAEKDGAACHWVPSRRPTHPAEPGAMES